MGDRLSILANVIADLNREASEMPPGIARAEMAGLIIKLQQYIEQALIEHQDDMPWYSHWRAGLAIR